METAFTKNVIEIIKQIPTGKVATYSMIARLAGSHKASRQVAFTLHSSSYKHNLPWHRVINRSGMISLKKGSGYEEQKALLESEGVVFDEQDRIDLKVYLWEIDNG